jgi:DNA-binding response OmpR family regulator
MTGDEGGTIPFQDRTVRADILIVDDEADVRRSMSEVLQISGFSVVEAEDGAVAYGLLRENRYGMVLLDIRMPKLDGVSLIEALSELPPVVVHSAFSLSSEDRARLGTKVVQYLHKPVTPRELLGTVKRVLAGGSDT